MVMMKQVMVVGYSMILRMAGVRILETASSAVTVPLTMVGGCIIILSLTMMTTVRLPVMLN